MAKLSELFKNYSVQKSIDVWKTFNEDLITRKKTNKKDRFILIQNRESALYALFINLKEAGFTAEAVKPYLLRIGGACSPNHSVPMKEKRGWQKHVSIDVAAAFNEAYEEEVAFTDVFTQLKERGSRGLFSDPMRSKEQTEDKSIVEPFQDVVDPPDPERLSDSTGKKESSIYIPKGDTVNFVAREEVSLEDLLREANDS